MFAHTHSCTTPHRSCPLLRLSSWIAAIILVTSLSLVLPAPSAAEFRQPDPRLDLLAGGVKVNTSVFQRCDDEFRCRRAQFTAATCLGEGVCREVSSCNGRMDFPLRHRPLQDWEMTALTPACVVTSDIPDNFHGITFDRSARTLFVNGSAGSAGAVQACNAYGNSSSDFEIVTLTFWLSADCNNCSVLALTQPVASPVHFRVVDGLLCVDQECPSHVGVASDAWTFVALEVYKNALNVYVGNKRLNLTSPLLQSVDVENIFIGSNEVTSPENEFSLYDVHFYEDVLTNSELKELHDGFPNTFDGACRCPPSHPILLDSGTECEDETGGTHPRFNTSVHFNPISVLTDPSVEGKWASAESGDVTVSLAFSQPFEIESVKLTFASVLPGSVSVSLKNGEVENMKELLQCTGSECQIAFQASTASTTVSAYKAKVASDIEIVLGRNSPLDVQSFVISNISVTGRCDCHGNADSCTVTDDTYSCQCKPETNSIGTHCELCTANFFRQTSDFGCPNSCSCSANGVADVTDQCEQTGGQCKCKEFVTGASCDECVPWTFGLDGGNAQGCSPCTCNRNGTLQCNNLSGECTCHATTDSPNCDSCKQNHFGLNTPQGCRPCDCDSAGTRGQALTCDVLTGQCQCKENVEGAKCDACKKGFFSLDVANTQGCVPCDCHPVGSDHSMCDNASGQCPCRNGVITDRKCSPEIVSIDPSFGPEIGGTSLTIHGHLLGNSTHQAAVFFGSEQQNILSIDDSMIIVNTGQHTNSQDRTLEVKVSWDGVVLPLASKSFSYRSNPVLDVSKADDVYTYVSGGCIVEVFGSRLSSVKYPRLAVFNKARPSDVAHGTCRHFRGYVTCVTPDVNRLYSTPQDEFQMTVVFDGVTSSNMGRIFVRDDPILYNAGNIRFQYPFKKTITLRGKNLQSACQKNGIEVLIDVFRCEIVSISNTHIECEPYQKSPDDGDKRVIEVRIRQTAQVVGTLEYLEFYETTGFIIICSCIGGLILIVVIIIIICQCRRYRRQHSKPSSKLTDNPTTTTTTTNRPMNTYSEITQLVSTVPTENGHSGMVQMENVVREPKKGIVNSEAETLYLNEKFLPYVEPSIRDSVKQNFVGGSSFTIGSCRKTGTGQHAKIMDGSLQRNGQEILKLSIRSLAKPISGNLKTSPDSETTLLPWANLALSECLRLRQFKHNHILNCLGIGLGHQRFHLLYAHSKNGTLKDLVADTSKDFSVRQLLGFSQQVAEGVAYLASKDVAHKDIAARNCVVDEYLMVKIGDASFSWDFYANEYVYNEERERYLPIRWMAPESLTAGFYDMRTDVWSFGVLVWELLTRGCLPFHEISDDQIKDYVLSGYVLGKPETIADNVYELLRNCWSPENDSRPAMKSLSRSLSYILESESEDTYANGYLVTAQLSQGVSTPRGVKNANGHSYNSTNLSHV